MTRPLLLTALCAFLAALGFFGAAFATASPRMDGWFGRSGRNIETGGPETTRTLTWSGEDELSISIPANVTYTQGPTTSLTVKGPKGTVEHVVVDGDRLKFDLRLRHAPRVQVTMTAPNVKEFRLMGSQRLDIAGYDQNQLSASIFGSGDVVVRGKADQVELAIFGSGDIDAGALAAREAEVAIHGSGDATIAPTEAAEVGISGSGDVTLRTPKLNSSVHGSGKIRQADS